MFESLIVKIMCPLVVVPSMLLVSSSDADASPTVTGQTFGDASTALSVAGFTAIVAATVGDRLSRDKCLVVSQRDESIAQRGSHTTSGTTVALSLNCDNQQASANKPGFSAASPEGRAAKAAASAAGAQPAS